MVTTSIRAILCAEGSPTLKLRERVTGGQQYAVGNSRGKYCSFSSSSLPPLKPYPDHVNAIGWAVNRRRTAKISSVLRCSRSGPIEDGGNDSLRQALRLGLWAMEGVYIMWLFLLPYAPGDPVWAISSETISSLVGLSLNFFFILPLTSASVGTQVLNAPVLHPMSEGLFNFVIAWTLMFAPLLYTDCKRDRYKGSLDVLWSFQMFLTNTFLIPYMALRLNEPEPEPGQSPKPTSWLGSVMIKGAPVVGLTGGAICLLSILWALYGRLDGNFGGTEQRWEYLISYLGSERLAYAFIWDIVLYTIFQPWLIGENLSNVQETKATVVGYLRFVPAVGLFAYLIFMDKDRMNDPVPS